MQPTKEKKRAQILRGAKYCFSQHGFHQTSMRQIIEKSGSSAGGVYHYFPSKESIVEAISSEEREEIDYLVNRLNKTKNSLKGIIHLVIEILLNTPQTEAALSVEIFAEACRNPQIKIIVDRNDSILKDAIGKYISTGQQKREFTNSMSSEDLTILIITLLEGLIGKLATDDLSPKRAASIARTIIPRMLCD